MKPEEMQKIRVTGPQKGLEETVEKLHSLGLMDLEDSSEGLERGDPLPDAENLSETLVDIRSVLSRLDADGKQEASISAIREKLPGLVERLEEIESERSGLEDRREALMKEKEICEDLGVDVDIEAVKESKRLDYAVLDADAQVDADKVYTGDSYLLAVSSGDLPDSDHELNGNPVERPHEIEQELSEIESDISEVESEKEQVEEAWGPKLNYAEDFIARRVEKAEAPLNFGFTESAFIAEGWIPADRFEDVRSGLEGLDTPLHVERLEGGEPPVKYDNPRFAESFESLTDLVGRPLYGEVDPTMLIFLTFPLFFGFMIGDVGYGLVSGALFYGAMKVFSGASDIFKSLLWCSAFTAVFGLIYGDAFGYLIFGEHSVLQAVHPVFADIPILYHRTEHWGQLFNLAAVIGFVHVNLGILIGAYNEYTRHGLMEALAAKGSWFLLQASVAAGILVSGSMGSTSGLLVGSALFVPAVALLYSAEGIQGVVEIPTLLSDILSYLRLFGVAVAAVALAGIVNSIANPLLTNGTATGLALGTLILMFGHFFNTFIKIMEGFLQGIRLHYVEFFGYFYQGGGRKYSPFGKQYSR